MSCAEDEQLKSHSHTRSDILWKEEDISLVETCEPLQQARCFTNNLYDETGDLAVPEFEYTPLDIERDEIRLLTLHPTDDMSRHIRCGLEIHPQADLPPFVAIQNARGYRSIQDAIEIDGKALLISVALERFLRYLRTRIQAPTRIWVRYICVLEFHLLEQKAYWTREFSDSMYARAEKVFDMHAVNNCLIENGYFEKTIDSRFTQWAKQWHGLPTDIVLPRVCPVRLGSNPDHDSPTRPFQYMPLDMLADEIRIICVIPADDVNAPLVMHAAHCPIKCEVTYIALSYCWGSDVAQERTTLNGQIMFIRKNLAEAIRFIRTTNVIVPLWIDAISINQSDITERSRQVKRMGEIYDSATMVYSWLGPATEDTEEAHTLIDELSKSPVIRFNNNGEFHFGEWHSTGAGSISYGENRINPSRLASMCGALYKLLTRSYFRRSWILQEVALASNPTVVAGRKPALGFETLDRAIYNFHDMLERDPSLAAQIQIAVPAVGQIDIDMLGYARKVFYFRHLLSRGSIQLFPFSSMKETSPGFLDALVLARDFECTDPRDRIFALWNLAQDKSDLDFTPNYNSSYEVVYTDFARAWIIKQKSLDILGAVDCMPTSSMFYDAAPSWCPNWNVKAETSSLVRKDYLPVRFMAAIDDQSGKIYSADGNVDGSAISGPSISFKNNALECTGVILDSIDLIFDDAPDIPLGTGPKSTWRFHFWKNAIEKHFQVHESSMYDDAQRAAHAMLHGDSLAAWPAVSDSGYDPDTCQAGERYVCLPANSHHVLAFANSYDRTQAWSVVNKVLRGRRPIVTENGYMGLAPSFIATSDIEVESGVQTTWQLAVVAGCSVPLILRARDDGTYQLSGTCFVQGWMEGEWIQTYMGAEDPQEFWRTIGESARLVIT